MGRGKGDSDEPASQRLGWWQTNLVGEGAEYDLKELLPNTCRWAVLQAVRHAAKIHDATVRAKDHDPDHLLALYSMGFEIDEKVDDRLVQFKQNSKAIEEMLPDAASMINAGRLTGSQVGLHRMRRNRPQLCLRGGGSKVSHQNRSKRCFWKAKRWTGTASGHAPDAALQTGREVMEYFETVEPHTPMMKCTLEVEPSRSYWEACASNGGSISKEQAFENAVFGSMTFLRI